MFLATYCLLEYFHEIGPLLRKLCQTITVSSVFSLLLAAHTPNSHTHSCKKQVGFAIRKVRVNYSFACSLFFACMCVSVYTIKKESGICVRDSWSLAQQFKLIRLYFVFYLSERFYIDYPEWKVYIKYLRRAEKKKKKNRYGMQSTRVVDWCICENSNGIGSLFGANT